MAINFIGGFSTFRVVGQVATPQNLLAIENAAASGLFIGLFEIRCYKDMTVLQNAIGPILRASRTTGVGGGTTTGPSVPQKIKPSGSNTHDTNCIIRGGASADGTNTLPTGTAGTTFWQMQPPKLVTAAGVMANATPDCLPIRCRTEPLVLDPGEDVLFQLVGAGLTSDHYFLTGILAEATLAADLA